MEILLETLSSEFSSLSWRGKAVSFKTSHEDGKVCPTLVIQNVSEREKCQQSIRNNSDSVPGNEPSLKFNNKNIKKGV